MKYFGKELSEIPCFRNTFLYGILTGIGSGLGFFLFTSRTKRSCDVGVGSFVVTSLAYWYVKNEKGNHYIISL